MRALTLGETMVLFEGVESDGLVNGEPFRVRVAGAESNFAIALTRLGVEVEWISRLGRDPFGDLVLSTLATEQLGLGRVRRDDAPTGVFFKWHEPTGNRVAYRRAGSAASRLAAEDVPREAVDGAALVHLSGITLALSSSARAAVLETARRAREAGAIVTFDPNYRAPLWPGPDAAAEALLPVLPAVDWVLCGLEEGSRLFATRSPDELRAVLRAAGAGEVAVRTGARGAVVWEDGERTGVAPLRLEDVVDEIGAGDGFAGGFAFGLLHGRPPSVCARAGNLVAACALRGPGDWETYPTLDELRAALPELA